MPGKALALLGGLAMVEHVRRRCLACSEVSRVVVATDHDGIAAVVRGHGGEVVLTAAQPTGTHRVLEVVEGVSARLVINVQGDMPLVRPDHVDLAVNALRRGDTEVVTLVAPAPADQDLSDPATVKVTGLGGGPVVFGRIRPRSVRVGVHLGIYGFTAAGLRRACAAPPDRDLEQRAWLAAGIPIGLVPVDEAPPSVDTAAQLHALERRFARGELTVPPPAPDPSRHRLDLRM